MCNDGTGALITLDDPSAQPPGLTSKNASECAKCGGKMQPYFQWKEARWLQRRANVPVKWKKKALIFPSWKPVMSVTAYTQLIERARVIRIGSILASELYCNGIEGEQIRAITYACDQGNDAKKNTTQLETLQGSTISILYACVNISALSQIGTTVFNISDLTIDGRKDFSAPCIKARINFIPREQFEVIYKSIPSSLMLVSESHKATRSAKYV